MRQQDSTVRSPAPKNVRRPQFQFTLTGLFVLMFVVAAASAPGYYMLHDGKLMPQSRLVGMLMVLAGPLLLMTLLSVLLAISGRGDHR